MLFSFLISLALNGKSVNDHRLIKAEGALQSFRNLLNVIAVDRSDVGETKILKEHALNKQSLDRFLGGVNTRLDVFTNYRDLAQSILNDRLG